IVVPKVERNALERLRAGGAAFPMLFVGHETKTRSFPELVDQSDGPIITLDRDEAAKLVPPPPDPVAAVQLGDRLGQRTGQIFHALRSALPIVGMVAAAPFMLVGAAVGALATVDPVLIGAIPAVGTRPGDPAAWYML